MTTELLITENFTKITSIALECNTNNLKSHNGNKCALSGDDKSVETWS